MLNDAIYADATRLAELIRRREVSPTEVVKAHLDRIAAVNPAVNAVVTLADQAISEAEAAEQLLAEGTATPPLFGVPFTVKDSIDTKNVPTQRGSPIYRGRTPDRDAPAVARMRRAGAILLAKTNLPEFSYSTESDNLLTGRTNNPWNLQRTSGGSSGGEAAAIAAGMSPLGLGTDLAISVRGPAAHCGVVALKPTHGRIPMTGVWPRVPRRDWHVGPMARTVRDVALAYALLTGPDGSDGFAVRFPDLTVVHGHAFRVGWLVDSGLGPIAQEVAATVRAAADALRGLDLSVEQVDLPALRRDVPLDLYNRQHVMEMKPVFREATVGHEDEMFSVSRGMLATPDTSIAEYVDAEQGIERLRDAFRDYFDQFDVLLLPVVPIPAHAHGLMEIDVDGIRRPAAHMQTATVLANLLGLPALSMRFGTSDDGLPIGVQIVADRYHEAAVLNVASRLEAVSPVRDLHPTL